MYDQPQANTGAARAANVPDEHTFLQRTTRDINIAASNADGLAQQLRAKANSLFGAVPEQPSSQSKAASASCQTDETEQAIARLHETLSELASHAHRLLQV